MEAASIQTAIPTAAKPRRRASGNADKRPTVRKAERVKATLLLSADADVRLTIHAKMLGLDRSELVDQLIREQLRRFVIQDRGGRASPSDGGDPATGGLSAV